MKTNKCNVIRSLTILLVEIAILKCRISIYLALAGPDDGADDELAVMAESGIWPVCMPRDALHSSA